MPPSTPALVRGWDGMDRCEKGRSGPCMRMKQRSVVVGCEIGWDRKRLNDCSKPKPGLWNQKKSVPATNGMDASIDRSTAAAFCLLGASMRPSPKQSKDRISLFRSIADWRLASERRAKSGRLPLLPPQCPMHTTCIPALLAWPAFTRRHAASQPPPPTDGMIDRLTDFTRSQNPTKGIPTHTLRCTQAQQAKNPTTK